MISRNTCKRISRNCVKHQVTPECQASPGARHLFVPPAGHFLHLCTDDLGFARRLIISGNFEIPKSPWAR
jgi:hypothetical protein